MKKGKSISSEVLEKRYVGKVFGNMKILGYSHKKKERHFFFTICLRCGGESIRRVDRGNPIYCSLCQKDSFIKHDHLASSFNKLYCSIRSNANTRGVEFNLTKQDVEKISQDHCFYCGQKPQKTNHAMCGNKRDLDSGYVNNGIDRLDSNLGYTLDNVVPCCPVCNIMKNKFTIDIFLQKVKLIYEKNFKKTFND